MKFVARLTVCAAVVVLTTGCAGKGSSGDVSYSSITGDLTPELQTLAERPVDIDRNMAVTKNQGWRMMWGDLGRAFYTTHPSRLSPYPTQNTSGVPY